jgi:TRAP-type mannitol/chloroaromatic compound transport system permease large subunit
LWRALIGPGTVEKRTVIAQMFVTLVPAFFIAATLAITYQIATSPEAVVDTTGLVQSGGLVATDVKEESTGLISQAEEDKTDVGIKEAPVERSKEVSTVASSEPAKSTTVENPPAAVERLPTPTWFWMFLAFCVVMLGVLYSLWSWERLEVFKMLLTSFFPLAILILAVLGSIVFGLATPTEAAAVGALGGCVLAAAYRFAEHWRKKSTGDTTARSAIWTTARELGGIIRESSFLTAKTSAMVCWLFVGSSIFSASFALLGGQEVVEKWVLSLDMSPVQFMILAQIIIFLLGWPLEWTEIIVIFMPIFIPLLPHFHIDPLFFGLLVALNLQTAFLSPPVAMAAFYLKGVSPPHVTLNAIFAGMMPFMAIQVIALVMLYVFPEIGLWLPHTLYK